MNQENQEAIDKLERIKAQMLGLLDEAAEVLISCQGDISHHSFDTWVARIETALTDQSEFCLSCDYTMEDAIKALKCERRAA
uniref:Uncharacterized protein n=1 Tax=Desulfobacca acetoxidans TaxID=60893 RepID=A0A7C3V6E6_9BACT